MNTVRFVLVSKPSNSKGWGRYSAKKASGEKVIISRTGNEWVSASHEGQAADGEEITVELQVALVEGRFRKQTVYKQQVKLIAQAGAVAELSYQPGSQGIGIRVEGARQA